MPVNRCKPLLLFNVGIITTSIALVGAGFVAIKDTWTIDGWRPYLLTFLGWMSAVILIATFSTFVIQVCMSKTADNAGNVPAPSRWVYGAAILPALPGIFAALTLINLAWRQPAHLFFWPGTPTGSVTAPGGADGTKAAGSDGATAPTQAGPTPGVAPQPADRR
jgi:hypothetical protein